MRQIELQEYEPTQVTLSAHEKDTLLSLREGRDRLLLTLEPASGGGNLYRLTAGSIVGAVEVENLSVLIRPKIGIPQLLSLACYAMGLYRARERQPFYFNEEDALPDTLALALTSAANRAFARGLLHGYRTEEESLYTVRGRIRFEDQMRRRFNVPLPVEVRYDEFTADILPNQLVKAAAYRLGGMRLRSTDVRRHLGRMSGLMDDVSLVEFPQYNIPEIRFDRLNEHYRHLIGLSRLILRHAAFEADRGKVKANGFLIDMTQLFQEFVTQALREVLRLTEREFGEMEIASLDEGGRVRLRPDLTWWVSGECRFVGDAKYKRVTNRRVPNPDIYQLLAYATALDLPGGMLIYAKGEAEVANHQVRNAGKRLELRSLDLSLPLEQILKQVEDIARRVVALRYGAVNSKVAV